MKTCITLFLTLCTFLSFSQCEEYFRKYESQIFKTTSYLGKDMRLYDAGTGGGTLDLYTEDSSVFLQPLLPVAKETCWDPENSSVTFTLESGDQVVIPFTDSVNDCDNISPSANFLISKENMKKLEASEAVSFTIKYKTYSETYNIPIEVNDDLMDSSVKAYPRKQLKESMTCLMGYGY